MKSTSLPYPPATLKTVIAEASPTPVPTLATELDVVGTVLGRILLMLDEIDYGQVEDQSNKLTGRAIVIGLSSRLDTLHGQTSFLEEVARSILVRVDALRIRLDEHL